MAPYVPLPPPSVNSTHEGGLKTSSPACISPPSKSSLNIAFINCVGQTKFPVAKQLEIESYIRSKNLDIIHLQECKIEEENFSECPYIRSNFNIFPNNTPNDTFYGTASLVRCEVDVSNVRNDDAGRVIIFDAAGCTWGNLYLPSGTDGPS